MRSREDEPDELRTEDWSPASEVSPASRMQKHLLKFRGPMYLGRRQELQEEATSESIHPPQSDNFHYRYGHLKLETICGVMF